MPMTLPPARTSLSDTYPNPSNAVARTGLGVLWDYVTGLLGSTGNTSGMLSASKILDPEAVYNISLVPSVASNALTMKLTSADGSTALSATNPATVAQRNVTLPNGTSLHRNITGDLTLVISSGSSLGHLSGQAENIYWYVIDSTGTQELACSMKDFGRSGIVSTTAEGGAGAADSGNIMYSATARTNVPFRRVGRSIDTQTISGTWGAVPTLVEIGQDTYYDENPWTPGFLFGGSAAGNIYTAQNGFYTRVGNLIVATFTLGLNTKGSGAGAVAINGLPFPAAGNTNNGGCVMLWAGLLTAQAYMSAFVPAGATTASVYGAAAATANLAVLADTVFGNTSSLQGILTYRAR